MKRKIFNSTLLGIVIGIFVCCTINKDKEIFNGEIQYIDDSHKVIKNITSRPVLMSDGIPTGLIAVYDSLLICWNSERDHFFNIINLDTGKEIGNFCEIGRGPREAISVNCIVQLFKKENDICTYLWAYNESRLFLWNISQSIEKRKTIYDTIVDYEKNRYFFLFSLSEDELFVNRPSDYLAIDEITMPFYEKRTISTQAILQDYRIYTKATLLNGDIGNFYTWDVMKSDGSKIAQAMKRLPQINILDTHTGDVIGYRIKNSNDFSHLLLDTDVDIEIHYINIHADNNYLYATYWGKEPWPGRIEDGFPFVNIIHIFDWNGKQLYELITDQSFFHIWVDPVRNRLYTINMNTDEVYYLDLNELNLLHAKRMIHHASFSKERSER
ncbi:MAG: hypothetical protein LBC84_08015 [Prevotellaceae bacterium]|jgi:hypothetical protein|nr:hypothetical protein [Prevotellaceae bacterium]